MKITIDTDNKIITIIHATIEELNKFVMLNECDNYRIEGFNMIEHPPIYPQLPIQPYQPPYPQYEVTCTTNTNE